MSFTFIPLADVRVTRKATPDSITVLKALTPLTIVDLTVYPGVDTFSVCLSYFKVAEVRVSVRVTLKPFAVSEVTFPTALVLTAIRVLHYALALAFAVNHHAEVNGLGKPPFDEVWGLL